MEIIIGRETGGRRIHCVVDGERSFMVGKIGSVPGNVSRQHCKITIDGDTMTVTNIKDANITYVDGNQILSKNITLDNNVELGKEYFAIPLKEIIAIAKGENVPEESVNAGDATPEDPNTFSLKIMQPVWEEYNARKLEITDTAAKMANRQRIQGILSMCGMCFAAVPQLGPFRWVAIGLALVLAVYFFVKGMNSDSVQRQINDLDEEYSNKYKCPNPECKRPFGSVPYRNIEYVKGCPACGCKYTH